MNERKGIELRVGYYIIILDSKKKYEKEHLAKRNTGARRIFINMR